MRERQRLYLQGMQLGEVVAIDVKPSGARPVSVPTGRFAPRHEQESGCRRIHGLQAGLDEDGCGCV